jgi:phosphoribosylamine--glycine ligase
MMKVLVVGSGGREHTIVWKLKQSPLLTKIYCAPGNAGIAADAVCVGIPVTDLKGLLNFAIGEKVDLTVVGPELPLVNGIVDLFEANGMAIFGPTQKAAELEGSKAFCKHFFQKYDIPTADFRVFTEYEEARKYIKGSGSPLVVKTDGLAAGKGALVCSDQVEALEALGRIMKEMAFGEAGKKVVVEERLYGDEVSVMALADGEHLVYMVPSQDHKRIYDNDQGPNTGGMGAYAPTPHIDAEMMQRIRTRILEPTLKGMALEGRPYRGVLYAGIMITKDGPKTLEYNCRFGDPETQVVLPLAYSDLLEAFVRCRNGQLDDFRWQNRPAAAICVVIASGGYPGSYEKEKPILGLDSRFEDEVIVFHAGTRAMGDKIVTSGGRVLGVTAVDATIRQAKDKVYRSVQKIAFDRAYYRKDIGHRVLNLERR